MHLKFSPFARTPYTRVSSRTQNYHHPWAKFPTFSRISNRFYIVFAMTTTRTTLSHIESNKHQHKKKTFSYTRHARPKKNGNLTEERTWMNENRCVRRWPCHRGVRRSSLTTWHTVQYKANWLFIHIKLSIPFCYHLVPNLTIYVVTYRKMVKIYGFMLSNDLYKYTAMLPRLIIK